MTMSRVLLNLKAHQLYAIHRNVRLPRHTKAHKTSGSSNMQLGPVSKGHNATNSVGQYHMASGKTPTISRWPSQWSIPDSASVPYMDNHTGVMEERIREDKDVDTMTGPKSGWFEDGRPVVYPSVTRRKTRSPVGSIAGAEPKKGGALWWWSSLGRTSSSVEMHVDIDREDEEEGQQWGDREVGGVKVSRLGRFDAWL